MNLLEGQKAFYQKAFFSKGTPNVTRQGAFISKISISLQTTDVPKNMILGNESYEVITNETGIYVSAYDTYGCSRALATVAQIITEKPGDEYETGLYAIQSVSVKDQPAYNYRAIMIDTARHFLPLSTIKRQISALAVSKFNTLHIHLIDYESNAFQPVTKPADDFGKAAYNVGGFYRHQMEDLTDIAKYANSLGIHIVTEFDMPGHVYSWRHANPDIIAKCGAGWPGPAVNPLNEQTYVYIEAYLKDLISSVYAPFNKYPTIHLGGDEVNHGCWNDDPNISKYLKENKMSTKQLWKNFHKRIADLLTNMSANSTRFYWEESFHNDNEMNTGAVVHSWYDQGSCRDAAAKGIKAIRSQGWYFDAQQSGDYRNMHVEMWMDFYKKDAADGVATEFKKNVQGGGACAWGERVNDGNIDENIWPRAIAVAESLWSSPTDRSTTQQLKVRLNKFLCKLINVGVATGPLMPSAPCPGIDEHE